MIKLFVKGHDAVAWDAFARAHNVPVAYVGDLRRETVLVTDDSELLRVMEWFADDEVMIPGYGHVDGTLLFFAHVGDTATKQDQCA